MKRKIISNVKKDWLVLDWDHFLAGSFFLFSFFLPLNTGISNVFLIFSMVLAVGFLYQNPNIKIFGIKKKMLIYSVLPFFLLHIMGVFYTSYPEDSYRYLEKTISFLLVPIIFIFFHREQLMKLSVVLLKGLLYGSVISLLILVTINLSNYFLNQDEFSIGKELFDYYHTYYNFTKPLVLHPTYLGVYYLTGMIFLGRLIQKKWIQVLLVTLFGIGFLFINSRIIFFSILLLVCYRIFQELNRLIKAKKYRGLLFSGLFLGLLLFIVVKLISETYIGYRLKNIYKFEISVENEANFNSGDKSNPRMSRWISALKLASERPLFGYGVADEYPNLEQQFRNDGLLVAANSGYNAHNQYIGYAIRFGVLGLFVLFFFFIANGKLAFATRDYDYFLLILIIACVNFVENYFDRNFGITFATVFFTTFSYNCLLKKGI